MLIYERATERFALGHKKVKSSEKTVKNTIFLKSERAKNKRAKSEEQKSKEWRSEPKSERAK